MNERPAHPPVPDLSARDRLQRARTQGLSPGERLAAMQHLIDAAWAVLQRHPEGLDHFRRRNFKARSIGRTRERRTDGA